MRNTQSVFSLLTPMAVNRWTGGNTFKAPLQKKVAHAGDKQAQQVNGENGDHSG